MSASANIQQAVVELVTLHTDFTKLISESDNNKSCEEQSCQAYTDGLLHSIEQQGRSSSETREVVAASLMSKQLHQILRCNTDSLLLTEMCRGSVKVYIDSIQHLQQIGCLSAQYFVRQVNAEGPLPLELIWLFHQADVMTLESYVTCNLGRPGAIGRLGRDVALMSGAFSGEDKERRTEIVRGLMEVLLTYGYSRLSDSESTASRGLRKVCCALLDSITKKSLQTDLDFSIYDFLSHVTYTDVPLESVQRYSARQLSVILSHKPQYKVSDALHQQQGWSLAKSDPCRMQGYTELLSPFSATEALTIFKNVIEEQEVNWRSVLTFTSVLLTCLDEAPTLLQGLCRELIMHALVQNELDGLITGFLLARQGALEGPHVFPSYQNWFYALFGEPHTTPATNKKTFGFLLKFLGDIVPYETVQHLKSHVFKPPSVPAKCRPLLSDYIALAKTRLMDLGERPEEFSIFGDTSTASGTDGATEKVVGDVETALESYEKTGRIPASVMEASIFRKPYFVGRFLPCLLKSRPLPDPPDIRMKLVESLHHAEKIPKSLYTVYKRESQRLTTQLLEGVFTDNDDEMEDLTLSPWQQLTKCLDALQASVISLHTPTPSHIPHSHTISAQLSFLYDKCRACVYTEGSGGQFTSKGVHIDLGRPPVTHKCLKVVDCVLHFIGQTLEGLTSHSNLQHQWLTQLVAVVTGDEELGPTLYIRLFDLVLQQGYTLSRAQVAMVAAVCVHILSDLDLSSVKVNEMTFVEALTSALKLSSLPWVRFTFRFLTEYLVYAVKSYPSIGLESANENQAVVPLVWCRMLDFLHHRLSYSSSLHLCEMEVTMTTASELSHSQELQHLWQAAKVGAEQWLELELRVNTTGELLSQQQRLSYYEDMVFGQFMPQLSSDQHGGHWSLQLSTWVVLALIDCQNRHRLKGFCGCDTVNHAKENQSNQFRPDITSLLQRLVQLFPPSTPPQPHWLLQVFSKVPQQCRGGVETYQKNTEWLLSLSDLLPPYLLMVNRVDEQRVTDVSRLVTHINTVWRDYTTKGCVLSKSRTLYLTHTLLTTQRLAPDWLTVVKKCPLVTASLQYHWSVVSSLFDHSSLTDGLLEILQPIKSVHTLCNRSLSTKAGSTENPDTLLVCMALLSLLDSNEAVSVDKVVTMATQWCCCSSLSGAVLSQLVWRVLHHQTPDNRLCHLLVTMVTTIPLCINLDSPRVFEQLCPENIIKLWPYVLLRVLLERSNMSDVLHNSDCLSLLLKSYILCTGLYQSGIQTTGPLSILCSEVQPLSLQFLLNVSTWLKNVLSATSGSVRSHIDRMIVEQCDPDVQNLVSSS